MAPDTAPNGDQDRVTTTAAVPVRVFDDRAEGRPVGYEATVAQIKAQGWTWLVFRRAWTPPEFIWICPSCGAGSSGTIGDTPRPGWDNPVWVLSGEPDKPTMTPSFGCPNWRDGVCNGHWWLRDGVLMPA